MTSFDALDDDSLDALDDDVLRRLGEHCACIPFGMHDSQGVAVAKSLNSLKDAVGV